MTTKRLFEAASERMSRQAQEREQIVLRYETDDDSRVREMLLMQDETLTDDHVDIMLQSYHKIAKLRLQLGID